MSSKVTVLVRRDFISMLRQEAETNNMYYSIRELITLKGIILSLGQDFDNTISSLTELADYNSRRLTVVTGVYNAVTSFNTETN